MLKKSLAICLALFSTLAAAEPVQCSSVSSVNNLTDFVARGICKEWASKMKKPTFEKWLLEDAALLAKAYQDLSGLAVNVPEETKYLGYVVILRGHALNRDAARNDMKNVIGAGRASGWKYMPGHALRLLLDTGDDLSRSMSDDGFRNLMSTDIVMRKWN